MDFNLTLGEDSILKTSQSVVIRQGSHHMDNINIDLGGKAVGDTAYLEFDLPGGRKHVSEVMDLSGNISYSVPSIVTDKFGLIGMQLVILAGGKVLKSQIFTIEVTPSVCAKHHFDEDKTNDILTDVATSILNIKKTDEKMKAATLELEKRAANGEFNGKDGADGKPGNIIGIASNGNWEIDGKDTGNPSRGEKGSTTEISVIDGYWAFDGVKSDVKAVGVDGKDGANGKDGVDGKNGTDGINGKDGADGKDGTNGIDGKDGADGKDGTKISIKNGYWVLDDLTTEYKVHGDKGEKGDKGDKGDTGSLPLPTLGTSEVDSISQACITKELESRFNKVVPLTGRYFRNIADDPKNMMAGLIFVGERDTKNVLITFFFKTSTDSPMIFNDIIANGISIRHNTDNTIAVLNATEDSRLRGMMLLFNA